MPEDIVVAQCSPTMAGLKTGNLFTCRMESKRETDDSIRRFNARFASRGVRLLLLKYDARRALVYMYRPARLEKDLAHPLAIKILIDMGYPAGSPALCVQHLIRRLQADSFPHEIGLFLGYPPEDVHGFIEHGARHAKCVGVWKVYGDEQAARDKFELFRKCRSVYCECYRKHRCFDRLVVATA